MRPRRLAALLAVVGLALAPLAAADAASGATACATGESCVLVSIDGASPSTSISYADVDAGDVNASYSGRDQDGNAQPSVQLHGVSLRTVVSSSGVDVDSIPFVEVSPVSGTVFAIAGADLAEPSPFPDGRVPLVYINSSDSLGYVTPVGFDNQPNDNGVTTNGGALLVTIHTTGRLLHPTIAATPTSVDAGSPVDFTASFASDPGTAIDYSWDFGDGGTASGGASVSHSYAAAGRYRATVTVRGADGSLGIGSSALVTVGAPAPVTTPGAGGGAATPAPTVATSTKPHSTPRATAKPATPKPASPKPATTKPTATPTKQHTAAATARPTDAATAIPTASPSSAPASTATATAVPLARPSGTPVSGVLIAGGDTAAGGAQPTADPESASTNGAGSPTALGWGSAAVAGTVVLLGAGALIETGLAGSVLTRLKRRIR